MIHAPALRCKAKYVGWPSIPSSGFWSPCAIPGYRGLAITELFGIQHPSTSDAMIALSHLGGLVISSEWHARVLLETLRLPSYY